MNAVYYRYNQGVTDIQATSITIIGEPQEVFTEIRRGTVGTKYVMLNFYCAACSTTIFPKLY